MGSCYNSNISTVGLVFYYDMYNKRKSWLGAPTTNLVAAPNDITSMNQGGGTASYNISALPTEVANASPSTDLADAISGATWIAQTTTTVTNGVQYMCSWFVKSYLGATTVTWTWGGAHQGTKSTFNVSLVDGTVSALSMISGETYAVNNAGNGWWKIGCSTTMTTGGGCYPQLTYIAGTGLLLCGSQFEQGNVMNRFVIGTRSTSITDLTGNNTITSTSLIYNSDDSFSFNGSTSLLTVPNTTSINLSSYLTAGAWVYYTSGNGRIIQKDGPTNTRCWEIGGYGGTFRMEMWHSSGTNTIAYGNSLAVNGWTYLALTFDGINILMYQNGVLVNTVNFPGDIRTDVTTPIYIGGYWSGGAEYFTGKISNAFVYNRPLTAAEVRQNFNAHRGRYGV